MYLSKEIIKNIKTHFPKADSVAIIRNPNEFTLDVYESIGYKCISETVKYFRLYGYKEENVVVNDKDYFMYLSQDIPPKIEEGKKIYSFNAKYVYRSLMC